jgi:formate hydrogenlyase subunit 3/multisubunit Na+/H+ antiporter MnhD subunit
VTTAALILAALCTLSGAALLDVTVGPGRPSIRPLPYLAIGAASVLLAVAGFRADLGHGGRLNLYAFLGFGRSALRADPLAGLFLALTGVVAFSISLAFLGWSRESDEVPYRGLAAAVALTIASVSVIVLADSAFVFLFAWEGLSVAFYLLTGYRRERKPQVVASMLTFGFSKLSGALLLLGFGLLYGATGSFNFTAWSDVGGQVHGAAYALFIAGFAIKVGLVPVQVWMPTGYGAAPGPARALMSAVAANVGFYGMWHVLGVLGAPPEWLAITVIILAGSTALLGIAHAAVQSDLQRLIAYSSVENGGLITAGFGIALVGAVGRLAPLVALGLLTSSLQMVAHALAKSSLFLSSAVIEQVSGTRDLDKLRGVGLDAPFAGATFSIGALTLAGLPLTVGFVSEWFLLEAVMQLFRLSSLTLAMSLALAGALIALAIGFAGFTFVRLVALTILGGTGQRGDAARAHPGTGWLGKLGLCLPALACVGLAALSPWEIRFLNHGLSALAPRSTTDGALRTPWVLQPIYTGFSALSPSWLAVEMPLLALAVFCFVSVVTRGSFLAVRRVPPWRSASGGVDGDARYTSFAFANVTRNVLANLLMTRSRVGQLEVGPDVPSVAEFATPDMANGEESSEESGIDRSGSVVVQIAGPVAFEGADIPGASYTTDVVEVVEAFLYRPLLIPLRRAVAAARRLQSGRLDAYISYMLVALVALIAVVVAVS